MPSRPNISGGTQHEGSKTNQDKSPKCIIIISGAEPHREAGRFICVSLTEVKQ